MLRYLTVTAGLVLAVGIAGTVLAQAGTASISGSIAMDNGADPPGNTLYVVPADTPQPLLFPFDGQYSVEFEPDNTFLASGLAGGDYLIAPQIQGVEFISPTPDATVTVGVDAPGSQQVIFPAITVTVADGQALTGVDIVLAQPQPCPFHAPCPLSGAATALPGEIAAPSSGSGSVDSANSSAYIGAAIAGAALVLLGGGIAMRVRQRRRSA